MKFIAEFYQKEKQSFYPEIIDANDFDEATEIAKAHETKDATLFNVVRA